MTRVQLKAAMQNGAELIRKNKDGSNTMIWRLDGEIASNRILHHTFDTDWLSQFEVKDDHLDIWLLGLRSGRNILDYTQKNADDIDKFLKDR